MLVDKHLDDIDTPQIKSIYQTEADEINLELKIAYDRQELKVTYVQKFSSHKSILQSHEKRHWHQKL